MVSSSGRHTSVIAPHYTLFSGSIHIEETQRVDGTHPLAVSPDTDSCRTPNVRKAICSCLVKAGF
ncbi:hypothetical protein [Burkholderia sp. S-53]|uniref:hypothetical protein n=1 Tax=Burkholderia sp. S-53 TaxID=2906514 RepID=UPI0021D1F6AF|nr:hypothetical protein [Burkholderia sp. S-53]UXU92177.1 hypothetical protein LXM88_28960 [Burkholderia sp. S-53]